MSPHTEGRVQVGLFLTDQQQLDSDQIAALDGQIRLAAAAHDAGWDSVFVGEHYLVDGITHMQSIPFLGRLAAETEGMRLGSGINLIALHNPVHLAETFACLDVISKGRFTWGVGLGYREVEYLAFGIDPAEKLRRFETNLDLVLRLWSGEAVDADEPWCHLKEQRLNLLPLQRPRPPVWMAANSDAAVQRAALLADSWYINPHAPFETIRRQLGLYREARHSHGLPEPTELPVMREIFCGRSREEALKAARPYLEFKYKAYANWGQDKVLPGNDSFEVPFENLETERFIIGSPQDCIEALLPWRDELGANHFIFRTEWVGMPADLALESIGLLTEEVIPVLKRR